MADYNSGLPIRSEADGTDERLHVKIVDGTNPAVNQTTVDSDKNLHVEIHGDDPSAVDHVIRVSELGALTPDGVYDASNNTKPGNSGLVGHTRAATPGDAEQVERLTAIANGSIHALDVSLHDEDGAVFSESNPLPVTVVGSEGAPINDYATSSAVAAGSSVNHDYTVTALKTLKLDQIECSASGKIKVEVKVETAAASGVFNTKWVQFNSTANPNTSLDLRELVSQVAGAKIRVVLTNKDNQPMDVYSTISGHEI
jgi:hypothetical protein